MGPTTSIEFLGINLDSVNFQASLPKEKNRSYHLNRIHFFRRLRLFQTRTSLAAGPPKLCHAHYSTGPPLYHASPCPHVIHSRPGRSDYPYNFFLRLPLDIKLFTDAAPSIGFGGYYQGRWFASPWPPQLLDTPQSSASSALFELYQIVVAASL